MGLVFYPSKSPLYGYLVLLLYWKFEIASSRCFVGNKKVGIKKRDWQN